MNEEYDDECDAEDIDGMPCGCLDVAEHMTQVRHFANIAHLLSAEDTGVGNVHVPVSINGGTFLLHRSHVPDSILATLSKSETVAESNSSAPLTGWTREWPTRDGWWWTACSTNDEPQPAFVYADADGDWHAHEADVHWSKSRHSDLMFHPMAQPPEPPKETP